MVAPAYSPRSRTTLRYVAVAAAGLGLPSCGALIGLDHAFPEDAAEGAAAEAAATGEAGSGDASSSDASGDASGPADAASDSSLCPTSFDPEELQTDFRSTGSDYYVRFSPKLDVAFTSEFGIGPIGTATTELFVRYYAAGAWSGRTSLLSRGANESAPTATADGSIVFYVSDVATGGATKLYRAHRAGNTLTGEERITSVEISSDDAITAPFLARDDVLYFSNKEGIARVDLLADGGVGARVAVALDTSDAGVPLSPVVTADERVIYFFRPVGVFYACRPQADAAFGAPMKVVLPSIVMTPSDRSVPSWLSRDGRILDVARPNGGGVDLYRIIPR